MGNDRTEWLEIAIEIVSYRAMYEFACHIIQSAIATAEDKRAARRLYRALNDIIDLPIAEAARLMKARKCYSKLVASLQSAAADNLAAPLSANAASR